MELIQLINRCQQGDLNSFEDLYKLYKHKALGTAYLISGNKNIAEDIVQEAFVICYYHIKELKNPDVFNIWFYKILVRVSWRITVKNKRYSSINVPGFDKMSIEANAIIETSNTDISNDRLLVRDAVKRLSPQLRSAIILFYYNEMTIKDISKVLDCFQGTVKSRLYKARIKLQVVEKSINEFFSIISVGRSSEKSDEELSSKLGFDVRFPEHLGNTYKFANKSLGVKINMPIDQATYSMLENDMFNAIEDDNALVKLISYEALRFSSVSYINTDGSRFYIDIAKDKLLSVIESKFDEFSKLQGFSIKRIKVDNSDGYWVKTAFTKYPYIKENGITKADMSVLPEIKEIYLLYWGKNDITYTLGTSNDFKLSMKESLKIAEEFMRTN